MNITIDEQFDQLKDLALITLTEFLQEDEMAEEDFQKARVAASSLSAYSRIFISLRARESLQWSILKEIIEDKQKLKRYVGMTFPRIFPEKVKI